MFNFLEQLTDIVFSGAGTSAKLFWDKGVPPHLKKELAARFGDLFDKPVAANHDLVRAVRLAWIEAALEITNAAKQLAKSREYTASRDAILLFAKRLETELTKVRSAAFRRLEHAGYSPIDAHLWTVLDGMPEFVAPAENTPDNRLASRSSAEHVHTTRYRELNSALTTAFSTTASALLFAQDGARHSVPDVFDELAQLGLPTKGGGPNRTFGELVFASFAELLKDPTRYPEALVAYQVTTSAKQGRLVEENALALRSFVDSMNQVATELRNKVVLSARESLIVNRDEILPGNKALLLRLGEVVSDIESADPRGVISSGATAYLQALPALASGVDELLKSFKRTEEQVDKIRSDTGTIKLTQAEQSSTLATVKYLVLACLLVMVIAATVGAFEAARKTGFFSREQALDTTESDNRLERVARVAVSPTMKANDVKTCVAATEAVRDLTSFDLSRISEAHRKVIATADVCRIDIARSDDRISELKASIDAMDANIPASIERIAAARTGIVRFDQERMTAEDRQHTLMIAGQASQQIELSNGRILPLLRAHLAWKQAKSRLTTDAFVAAEKALIDFDRARSMPGLQEALSNSASVKAEVVATQSRWERLEQALENANTTSIEWYWKPLSDALSQISRSDLEAATLPQRQSYARSQELIRSAAKTDRRAPPPTTSDRSVDDDFGTIRAPRTPRR